ncbi:uncharacterized protein si:dkey-6e2.2 isoform X1 [Triplophysa rosa]|uniref:Myb/SANT-like DNA-binding domain-containing protein n=1 Tax=Triplophysa rosa TaxID=992332 RepID=A0A9W7WSY3_TRIRA|nr:uncharacterized protein si:dkey-6e2.2 isoform X1 [Triplophysa rosa]KAI7807678.1 hypothetical protein IRJ41_008443 [Triplophysa rosa]
MSEERYVERNWTESETRALLRIRGNEELSRQISGTVRDSLIYGEITRLLRAQGINRSHRQVTNKLKTLRNKFRKIHEHHKNSGLGRVYWSFYDLCKSIWGTRRPANTSVPNAKNVKLEEPQSTSIEENRSTDIEVSVSNDEETDITPKVTEPPKKKAKKDHIAESIGDEEAFHIQDEREYEERLRREAREEQKEERASLMSMWKEMMEFQGNLLKEFIHHPSRPASGPYHKHAHYNQGSSSFASTSYTAPYDSPGMETENESAISQEEEEEKYLPSEIPVIVDVASLKRTNDDQSNITLPLSPQPTQSTEETDLQMSVLRRQEKVLQLQEEYYTIKIKYLKDQMARDQGQIIKC